MYSDVIIIITAVPVVNKALNLSPPPPFLVHVYEQSIVFRIKLLFSSTHTKYLCSVRNGQVTFLSACTSHSQSHVGINLPCLNL